MTESSIFNDKVTLKIWAQYFRRLDALIRVLDEIQRHEMELEIKGHLLESFQSDTAGSEAERLLNAIERLGEPGSYIKPMLAERLLSSASRSLRPKYVLKGLYYHFVGGARKVLAGVAFAIGYLLVFILALIGILKVFFPSRVGLFLHERGGILLGMDLNTEAVRTEVLGYWITPICLGLAFALYFGLTKFLKMLKRK